MWNKLNSLYQTNSTFRLVVQSVEGGAMLGFITATANGFDLSKKGLVALAAGMGGGVLVAIRNLVINYTAMKGTK